MKYILTFILFITNISAQVFNLVPIVGGTYTQGDSFVEGSSWEVPIRSTTVSSYSIGEYEVTTSQAVQILQYAYSGGYITVSDGKVYLYGTTTLLLDLSQVASQITFSSGTFSIRSGRGNHPITWITWYGSVALCNWASEIDSLQPVYNLTTWTWDISKNGYRLPTEAEWEYAARAGTSGSRFTSGNVANHSLFNYQSKDGLPYDEHSNIGYNPLYSEDVLKSAPVGSFSANAFGVYEMSGNVYEIVWDYYVRYSSTAVVNPVGPTSGTTVVWRGGSWKTSAANIRNSHRYRGEDRSGDAFDVGFRVAQGSFGSVSTPSNKFWYVSKTGNDSNIGSEAAPFLTIKKAAAMTVAGDTVIIGDGDYDEMVRELSAGTASAPITYQAANKHKASLRSFRISAPYVNLDGLWFTKYSNADPLNTWNAAVRLEPAGSGSTIENCLYTGYPYVLAHDFQFDASQNKIISPSSNFLAAGFVPGSQVYLGASGATYNSVPVYFVNHDTEWTVSSVEAQSMTLSGGVMQPDTGTNYWSFVRAGASHDGNPALLMVKSGGLAANNVTFRGNKIVDWPAHAIEIYGSGCVVEDNYIEDLKSFRFIQINGSNHVIQRNIIKNCTNVLHYSEADMDTIDHPAGTGWYDYQVGMIVAWNTVGQSNDNVLFHQNWIENMENQMGRADSLTIGQAGTGENITYSNNVFIGVSSQFNGGRPGMKWLNNTFYQCVGISQGAGATHVLAIGAREDDVPQTGYQLLNNMFVACGPKGIGTTETRGFYAIANWVIDPVKNYNFVTSDEVTGYLAKTNFTETNGITGGDPVFVSEIDFDGQDDIPFTADDGLRVKANSPAAILGGGALGIKPVISGEPQAHFRITSPTGWFEGLGEAYDPTWITKLPTQRADGARPWQNPVSIGEAPVTATFSADKSISGVGGAITSAAITAYNWNFGDGGTATGQTPSHTFTSGGDFIVTLTVTNSEGNSDTYKRIYRVTGTVIGQVPPSAPTNLRLR